MLWSFMHRITVFKSCRTWCWSWVISNRLIFPITISQRMHPRNSSPHVIPSPYESISMLGSMWNHSHHNRHHHHHHHSLFDIQTSIAFSCIASFAKSIGSRKWSSKHSKLFNRIGQWSFVELFAITNSFWFTVNETITVSTRLATTANFFNGTTWFKIFMNTTKVASAFNSPFVCVCVCVQCIP